MVREVETPFVGLGWIGGEAQRELGQLGGTVRCAARPRAQRRGVEHAGHVRIGSGGREREVTRTFLEVVDHLRETAVHRAQLGRVTRRGRRRRRTRDA